MIVRRVVCGGGARAGDSGWGGDGVCGRWAERRGRQAKLGFDVANMDKTCKPCDDFYKYVNGGWMKKNPIPAQYPAWGPDQIMFERTEARLHEILEAAAANRSAAAGSNEQKVGDYYASCMDTKAIEAKGLKPLDGDLQSIAAMHDGASLLETAARLQEKGDGRVV